MGESRWRRFRRRAGEWISGEPSLARISGRQWARGRRDYDAASKTYRTEGWTSPSASDANVEVYNALDTTRDRCRDLVRNNAWAWSAVEKLTSNLVGLGVRPSLDLGNSSSADALERAALDLWESWGRVCSPSSPLGIYGLQALIARAFFESGECLVRRHPRAPSYLGPGLPPVQVQALEGDFMPLYKYSGPSIGIPGSQAAGNNLLYQGIEFDGTERRVAYHLYTVHPGSTSLLGRVLTTWQTVRVPAEDMIHLYQERRPGQVRGMPWLAQVVPATWDLGGYADAERVRAKSAAMLFATVQGGDIDAGVPTGSGDGIAPAADADGDLVVDGQGNPVEQFSPGFIAYLPAGKEINVNQPGTAAGYADYVRASLHEIASGVGLSYEVLTGDLSQVSFSATKLGLIEQHRLIRALRQHVFVPFVCEPLWRWFLDAAQTAGLLPDEPGLSAVRWSEPEVESADREGDVKADLLELRIGKRSRPEIIRASGRDADAVDSEIARDQRKRVELGIVSDGDAAQTTLSGALQAPLVAAGKEGSKPGSEQP